VEGRANADTFIQKEGSGEWKPLGTFPELASCLQKRAVATGTRPPYIGTAPPPDTEAPVRQAIERGVTVQIGSCLNRSRQLLMGNFWMIVISSFLVLAAYSASSAVPYLGGLISVVLQGPLFGGLWWYFLKQIRGMEAEIPDAFAGFTMGFVQLMLVGVVTSVLSGLAVLLVMIPFLLPLVGVFVQAVTSGDPDALSGLGVGAWVSAGVGVVVACLVGAFLNAIWVFAYPLVIDKKLTFWAAMETSRKIAIRAIFRIIGMTIILAFVWLAGIVVGICACCVGLLVTIPAAMSIGLGAFAYAYEDNFGPPFPEAPQS